MKTIDINCDLGEGMGNEAQLMPLISSCNIACGGHAGDLQSMKEAVILAKSNHVKIGAHPSFPDKLNFGRTKMDMNSTDLFDALKHQIELLKSLVERAQLQLHHVKPHGALYNIASVDERTAKIVVGVVKTIDENLIVYAPFKSVISEIAKTEGIKIMHEVFADRNYNDDLTLVSRNLKNALIHDPNIMFDHVYNMIHFGKVNTINKVEVELKADTFCVHGDGKNVVENLKQLIAKLKHHHIEIS